MLKKIAKKYLKIRVKKLMITFIKNRLKHFFSDNHIKSQKVFFASNQLHDVVLCFPLLPI